MNFVISEILLVWDLKWVSKTKIKKKNIKKNMLKGGNYESKFGKP